MNKDELHPTVVQFKGFINNHPKLIEEIRKSGSSWQEYYEKWALLGEDDPIWNEYKNEEKGEDSGQSDFMNQLLELKEKIDLNKVQKQVAQLSDGINIVQELLSQFQDTNESPLSKRQSNPFNWFQD